MKTLTLFLLLMFSSFVHASGAAQTVKQIYYCGEDFAMRMSGGEWYLVQKQRVGEKKFDHFLSMALLMLASGKKTANVFSGDPIPNWCGNANFRPISIFSIQAE